MTISDEERAAFKWFELDRIADLHPGVGKLLAPWVERVMAARFVATYWRDEYLKQHVKGDSGWWAVGTHPLSLVIAALEGETDPRQLGIPESEDERFRSILKEGDA